jgi:hypothetical protein
MIKKKKRRDSSATEIRSQYKDKTHEETLPDGLGLLSERSLLGVKDGSLLVIEVDGSSFLVVLVEQSEVLDGEVRDGGLVESSDVVDDLDSLPERADRMKYNR